VRLRGARGARWIVLALALSMPACWREQRLFRGSEPSSSAAGVRQSTLSPGPAEPNLRYELPDASNAYAIAQGKRLFSWYNCVGCHAHGGGGMGPPLMDAKWIYGSDPEEIFATIVEGRPNGMPSFRGRIPPEQVWQIVAYVLSLSGNVRMDAAPGRTDEMQIQKPENMRHRAVPQPAPGAHP